MKIKILLFLLILVLPINLRSQTYTSLYERITKGHSASKGSIPMVFSFNYDFNNDGINEVFKGIMLKNINENIFWIKNAQILNSENKVVVDFGKNITVNGRNLTEQISSVNGYVIEILNNDNKNQLLVSIANAAGEKNSDELLINIERR